MSPHGAPQPTKPSLVETADGIRDLYAEVLDRPDATTGRASSSLGGDSLSYVEMSTRLVGLSARCRRTGTRLPSATCGRSTPAASAGWPPPVALRAV